MTPLPGPTRGFPWTARNIIVLVQVKAQLLRSCFRQYPQEQGARESAIMQRAAEETIARFRKASGALATQLASAQPEFYERVAHDAQTIAAIAIDGKASGDIEPVYERNTCLDMELGSGPPFLMPHVRGRKTHSYP